MTDKNTHDRRDGSERTLDVPRRSLLKASGAAITLASLPTLSTTSTAASTSGKTRRTYYSQAQVSNARANVDQFEWAEERRDDAVADAELYLERYDGLDGIWNLVTSQKNGERTLARGIWVSWYHEVGSPTSGTEIYDHGYYPWEADPANHPWKVIDPVSGDMFPSNDFQAYLESGRDEHNEFDPDLADDQYLVNELYPDKPDDWGVDDGTGWVDENGNPFEFVSYYNHWHVWYEITDMLEAFRDAYLFSGQQQYARAGTVLLDRIADVYSELDISVWTDEDYILNSHGGTGQGKAVGCIWETGLVQTWLSAYDAFFPAQAGDDELVSFLEGKASEYALGDKSSVENIRDNVETGLVRRVLPAVKNAQIRGNFGSHQSTLATSAVVQDDPEGYTADALNFLFRAGDLHYEDDGTDWGNWYITGGNVLARIVDVIDRDGHNNESVGYNDIALSNIRSIADILDGYDAYEGADLYKNVKVERMHDGRIPLVMLNQYMPHIGDTGSTGSPGIELDADIMIDAFERYGDPGYAQAAYLLNGNSVDGVQGDIFDANPEQIAAEIESAVEAEGPLDLDSTMLAGYGFTALRAGHSDAADEAGEPQRAFWHTYGRNYTSHNNLDTLNLGIFAKELNLAPDLGYPTHTGDWPSRVNWQSNTISHNTVVVDERGQESQWVSTPRHYDDGDRVRVSDVEAPDVYPQTDEYRRTTVMVDVDDQDSYAVDLFRITGGDDHRFSFHGAEGPVSTTGLTLSPQDDGTYAGEDVPEPDYGEVTEYNEEVGNGFNYLSNVSRDAAPAEQFSVDWDVVDTWDVRDDDADVHARLTMLGDLSEVALADGPTPQQPGNPEHLRYLIARRSGTDLESTFLSVLEPYEDARAVESISEVEVTSEDGDASDARAVKIELATGRTDYVANGTNPDLMYEVGDAFKFKGFLAVYSEVDGEPEHAYLHDGKLLVAPGEQGPPLIQSDHGRFEGVVDDFTRELAHENELEVTITAGPWGHRDIEDVIGNWAYVTTDGDRNGAYEITDVTAQHEEQVTLAIGEKTTVEEFVDPQAPSEGYQYIVSEGTSVSIPLSDTWTS